MKHRFIRTSMTIVAAFLYCGQLFASAVAVESIRKVAEELGDPSAQFLLGHMYESGQDVEKNIEEATTWYTKAAQQGHKEAQLRLGTVFYRQKDYGKALQWFKLASSNGVVDAHYWLGKFHLSGIGTGIDLKQGVALMQRAAARSHALAQYEMGLLYEKGSGVKKSYPTALSWFKKAAVAGVAEAQVETGKYFMKGIAVRADAKVAARWFKRAARKGSPEAKKLLAGLSQPEYKYSSKSDSDDSRGDNAAGETKPPVAVPESKPLAGTDDANNPKSMFDQGIQLESGRGVQKNLRKAITLIKQAARADLVDAQLYLAEIYAQGRGVRKNAAKAVYWYKKAARAGSPDGAFNLANH